MFDPCARLTGLYLLAGLARPRSSVAGPRLGTISRPVRLAISTGWPASSRAELPLPGDLASAEHAWQTAGRSAVVTRRRQRRSFRRRAPEGSEGHAGRPEGGEAPRPTTANWRRSLFCRSAWTGRFVRSTWSRRPCRRTIERPRGADHGSDWHGAARQRRSRALLSYVRRATIRRCFAARPGRSGSRPEPVAGRPAGGGRRQRMLLGAGSWWLAAARSPDSARLGEAADLRGQCQPRIGTPLTLLRASAEVALRGLDAPTMTARRCWATCSETDHEPAGGRLLLLWAGRRPTRDWSAGVSASDLAAGMQRKWAGWPRSAACNWGRHRPGRSGYADPTGCARCSLGLLDNALRRTPPGGRPPVSPLARAGWTFRSPTRGAASRLSAARVRALLPVDSQAGEETRARQRPGHSHCAALVGPAGGIRWKARSGGGLITLTACRPDGGAGSASQP
jgi:hypothetical protein